MANSPTVDNVDAGGQIVDNNIPVYIHSDTINTLTRITDTPCTIVFIYWYNPTTAGDLAALKDSSGNMLFPMRATANNGSLTPGSMRLPAPNGIYMDDLDSGSILLILG